MYKMFFTGIFLTGVLGALACAQEATALPPVPVIAAVPTGVEGFLEVKGNTVTATLPAERPLVYYLYITDHRGFSVSTPHDEAN